MSDQTGLSSQSNHASLNTHCLALGSVEVVCAPGQLLIVDIRVHVHLPGVDLHDPGPGLLGGGGELDLPVQSAGPEQGGVQDVDPVGGRDDLERKEEV